LSWARSLSGDILFCQISRRAPQKMKRKSPPLARGGLFDDAMI